MRRRRSTSAPEPPNVAFLCSLNMQIKLLGCSTTNILQYPSCLNKSEGRDGLCHLHLNLSIYLSIYIYMYISSLKGLKGRPTLGTLGCKQSPRVLLCCHGGVTRNTSDFLAAWCTVKSARMMYGHDERSSERPSPRLALKVC